jgi:tetratricopeptide (TPR) repeat protein
LALAIGAVYGRALDAPLFFDDVGSIVTNPSIVSLWPPFGTVGNPGPLRPPSDRATAARPLVNLSFALNYYFGGLEPWGYHVVNVLIHLGSALLLWAILRHVLLLPYFAGRFETSGGWLALGVALIWALHPLQTEAVIYATQRTELLMAFFYLSTLYCSLRYWEADPRSAILLLLAIVACACGMASKEVMVSAPLIVLLFERTFVAGSLPAALRRSWPLYVGLAATWPLLLVLVLNAPHSESAGFGLGPPLSTWWLTQSQILITYLKLAVWPSPLLIHYQLPYLSTFADAWMYVAPILALGFATLVLLWRNRPAGFLGTWIFAILAPTTVIPIVTEMAAERRMYLPLAALLSLFVVSGYLLTEAIWRSSVRAHHRRFDTSRPRFATAIGLAVVAFVFAVASAKQLSAYHAPELLWREVVAHQPKNFLARGALGGILVLDPNRQEDAIGELQAALALKPDYSAVLCDLGLAYINTKRLPEAIDTLHAAIAIDPESSEAFNRLGIALTQAGRLPEAIDALRVALKLKSENSGALKNLGHALLESGRPADAIEPLQHALRLVPDDAEAHVNLGRALMNSNRSQEAVAEFQAALALSPKDPTTLNNLGFALTQLGRHAEAIECLERAVQLKPDYALARNNLGIALFNTGKLSQAIDQFQLVIKLTPNDISAHNNLGLLLAKTGNPNEAIKHYQEVLRLQPNFVQGYRNLAQAFDLVKQPDAAIATAKKGTEVARTTGQTAAAEQIEEWLSHYQKERDRDASQSK